MNEESSLKRIALVISSFVGPGTGGKSQPIYQEKVISGCHNLSQLIRKFLVKVDVTAIYPNLLGESYKWLSQQFIPS